LYHRVLFIRFSPTVVDLKDFVGYLARTMDEYRKEHDGSDIPGIAKFILPQEALYKKDLKKWIFKQEFPVKVQN